MYQNNFQSSNMILMELWQFSIALWKYQLVLHIMWFLPLGKKVNRSQKHFLGYLKNKKEIIKEASDNYNLRCWTKLERYLKSVK